MTDPTLPRPLPCARIFFMPFTYGSNLANKTPSMLPGSEVSVQRACELH